MSLHFDAFTIFHVFYVVGITHFLQIDLFLTFIWLILFYTGEMSVEVTVCEATDLEDGQSVNEILNIALF